MEYKDYYKILGVKRDANLSDIKRAYHKLARKYHPDLNKESDSEERFKEVNEAYHALKDPQKRQAYDELGSSWQQGEQFRPPPGWTFRFSDGGLDQSGMGHFSDFFESLFGSAMRSGMHDLKVRGQDLHTSLRIRMEEAYSGVHKMLSVRVPEYNPQGQYIEQQHKFNVEIPPGVYAGQKIRLGGQGSAGRGGGPAGDLYLEILFTPHPLFSADGRDIFLELPVTPWEVALGCQLKVPTLSGLVKLKIPTGSNSGLKLRLKGRGLPGQPPGDQYVVLRLETPPADSDKARDFYRKMAELMPFNPRQSMGK